MESFEAVFGFTSNECPSERSFSALRLLKTYLCTTMTQEQLNNLMVLYVHKECLDDLKLEKVAEEFVSGRDGRQRVLFDEWF